MRKERGGVSASLGFTDYPQVDMLGLLYKFVNRGVGNGPGTPVDEHEYAETELDPPPLVETRRGRDSAVSGKARGLFANLAQTTHRTSAGFLE